MNECKKCKFSKTSIVINNTIYTAKYIKKVNMSEENKMPDAVVSKLKLDLMEKCKCGNNLEALFICKVDTCKSFEKQRYYCLICFDDEEKHNHKSLSIAKEVEK